MRKGPLCLARFCELWNQRSLQPSGSSGTLICRGRDIGSCPRPQAGPREVHSGEGGPCPGKRHRSHLHPHPPLRRSSSFRAWTPRPPQGPRPPGTPRGRPLQPESPRGKATQTDAGPAGSFWDFYFFKIIHTNGYSHKHDFNQNIASLPHQQDGTRAGRDAAPSHPQDRCRRPPRAES